MLNTLSLLFLVIVDTRKCLQLISWTKSCTRQFPAEEKVSNSLFDSQVILSNDVKNDIETHKSTNVLNNNMLKLCCTSSTLPVKIQKHAACLSPHESNRSTSFTEIGSIELVDNLNTNTFLDLALLELKAIQARLFVSKSAHQCTLFTLTILKMWPVTTLNTGNIFSLPFVKKALRMTFVFYLKRKFCD
jgi:hypothetical protein